MLGWIIRYVAALLVLAVGDAIWLSYFARAMFRPTLGAILLDDPRWWAVGVFYPLYALGVVFFAVAPALREGSWTIALFHGALFGLMVYATYDLTNLASIKAWTVQLALIDSLWGTFLSASAACAAYWVGQRFAQ